MKKKITILGSTGSIGRATLEVIDNQRDTFEVFSLACKGNTELLNEQIDKFKPKYVCIYEESLKEKVRFDRKRLFTGIKGVNEIVNMEEDIVVNAMPGSIGLEPTISALKSKKVLALANKESLVMAGRIVSKLLKAYGSKLIPIDSEHSALFQVMKKIRRHELKTITITASGGPFREHTKTSLAHVRPEEALNHPTWKMGNKVTLDSATLMNKGLEVIEARWLFNIQPELIRVLVHPESIIHGMIECVDGAFIAYMANPDMKIPISFAINEGKIRDLPSFRLNLEDLCKLTFYTPDIDRFPSLRLAFDALHAGDSALVVLNASNEVASEAFIEGRIRFIDIPVFIEEALEHHPALPVIEDIETIWEIHNWTKRYTEEIIKGRVKGRQIDTHQGKKGSFPDRN
ncbi:MAG: 1-deoxy-D-xylulose-5-phosphate reductoisomerase [Proteobacteria bacterium]|nr:1-deoxy-D-xylulose-5-phosphate reductoisomerase [Pseudomonadota bacterium]